MMKKCNLTTNKRIYRNGLKQFQNTTSRSSVPWYTCHTEWGAGMRVLLQRVKWAKVTVSGEITGEIAAGLLLLIGIGHEDTAEVVKKLAEKVVNLRIFNDHQGKMNSGAREVNAEILVVSQFTLYADCKSGRRPGFSRAATPEQAEPLMNEWVQALKALDIPKVATGHFGANMLVELANDGPVTILLDSQEKGNPALDN
jgi:D-tyrosyl-tRNA(Tyr) deacylase